MLQNYFENNIKKLDRFSNKELLLLRSVKKITQLRHTKVTRGLVVSIDINFTEQRVL